MSPAQTSISVETTGLYLKTAPALLRVLTCLPTLTISFVQAGDKRRRLSASRPRLQTRCLAGGGEVAPTKSGMSPTTWDASGRKHAASQAEGVAVRQDVAGRHARSASCRRSTWSLCVRAVRASSGQASDRNEVEETMPLAGSLLLLSARIEVRGAIPAQRCRLDTASDASLRSHLAPLVPRLRYHAHHTHPRPHTPETDRPVVSSECTPSRVRVAGRGSCRRRLYELKDCWLFVCLPLRRGCLLPAVSENKYLYALSVLRAPLPLICI